MAQTVSNQCITEYIRESSMRNSSVNWYSKISNFSIESQHLILVKFPP